MVVPSGQRYAGFKNYFKYSLAPCRVHAYQIMVTYLLNGMFLVWAMVIVSAPFSLRDTDFFANIENGWNSEHLPNQF